MWITARELRRIERERSSAEKRATLAESRLEQERERANKLQLALMDVAAKKLGSHAVSTQVDPPPEQPPETQEQFMERLKTAMPQWEYYRRVAEENGKPESEAEAWLLNDYTGSPQPFQLEN